MTNFLLTPYDPRTGRYGSISKSVSGRGSTRPLYIKHPEQEEDTEEDIDLDLMSDEVLAKIEKRLGMNYMGGTDKSRSDKASLVGNNAILEDQEHTTTVVKGLSPRLTYRTSKNSKGPAFGTQSSATYIRNRPGRISGTQYGTSRAPFPLTDIGDESVEKLQDIPDPMERAFLRHQNRVKKTLNLIKECLNEQGHLKT